MVNTQYGRELVEMALDFQLETITIGGELLAEYLTNKGFKHILTYKELTNHKNLIKLAEEILEGDWESLFSREAVEVLDMVWETEYHHSIMGKLTDFTFLHWVLQNKYHTNINLMEAILIWAILYIGE